ncbi:MAG: hypothetical protein KDB01_04720 [Planctomycetaceae bacterium]|nr:hypothetical protein [Planctomycetaceae bacterium]
MLLSVERLVCLGTAVILLAGCGGSNEHNIVVDPDALPFVQCKIQMAGQTVEYAEITLQSTEGQTPEIASTYDSDNSCYRFITTMGSTKKGGVPVGTYLVAITPGPQCTATIPRKFSDPAQSGLTMEIKPGENFVPTIELTP